MAAKKELTQEEKEEKKENKLNSRKFLIWLSWSVLIIALLIIGFTRDNDAIILKAVEDYFLISACYIGGNCLTKGIYTYKDIKTGNTGE